MGPALERLPWDSTFFGFEVGRVTAGTLTPEQARDIAETAATMQLRCAYFLADGDSADTWRAAAGVGFDPIDIRLELTVATPESGLRRELADAADEPLLAAIAREQAFSSSRFYRDRRFPREKATELFEIWTRRGVAEERWFTVVERSGSKIEGFVTARTGDRTGSIELVAVAADARGRGVGRRVVAGALSELAARGASAVTVVTQGSNLAAQRLYADCGFRVSNCGLWFHWWAGDR